MSRAERRRAEQAARKQAERARVLEAKRARDARIRARDGVDSRPLVVKIAKFVWDAFLHAEMRDFWRFAGVMSWIGWAMGIETRDRRLPAWTGLNQDPDAPAGKENPKPAGPSG